MSESELIELYGPWGELVWLGVAWFGKQVGYVHPWPTAIHRRR